jgi:hypothetical protein
MQAQLAELGEDLHVEAVIVGVGRRVGSALTDLAHPNDCRLAEPGIGTQDLRLFPAALTQLVLDRVLRRGLGRAPAGYAAGDAVEVPEAAAGDPLAAITSDLDAAVVAERERWTSHRSDPPGRVSVQFDLSGG